MFSGLEHMSPKEIENTNISSYKDWILRKDNSRNLKMPEICGVQGEQWALEVNVSFNMGRGYVTLRKQSSNS